jgi:hypothetical protein
LDLAPAPDYECCITVASTADVAPIPLTPSPIWPRVVVRTTRKARPQVPPEQLTHANSQQRQPSFPEVILRSSCLCCLLSDLVCCLSADTHLLRMRRPVCHMPALFVLSCRLPVSHVIAPGPVTDGDGRACLVCLRGQPSPLAAFSMCVSSRAFGVGFTVCWFCCTQAVADPAWILCASVASCLYF